MCRSILGHWINCFFAADVCQFSNPVMLLDQAEWKNWRIYIIPIFLVFTIGSLFIFLCENFASGKQFLYHISTVNYSLNVLSSTIQRIVMWNTFKELIVSLWSITCYEKHASRKQCMCILFVYLDLKVTL